VLRKTPTEIRRRSDVKLSVGTNEHVGIEKHDVFWRGLPATLRGCAVGVVRDTGFEPRAHSAPRSAADKCDLVTLAVA
jgi:hypothetical protein